jgi:hypothetical protein
MRWAKALLRPKVKSSKAKKSRIGLCIDLCVGVQQQFTKISPTGSRQEPVGQCKGAVLVLDCCVYRYAIQWMVIKTFRHKGLQAFFERGTKAGVQAAHAPKLARLLARLNESSNPEGMNLPG